jgi:hypothetical protein
MGGDDSQKLLPRRGMYSSPGRRKPPAHCKINTLAKRLNLPPNRVVGDLQVVLLPSDTSVSMAQELSWNTKANSFFFS